MKRIISTVLIAASLLSLYACGDGPKAPNSTPTPQESQKPALQHQATQLPMVAVALPSAVQEHTAQDGTLLLRTVYQNMELTVPDPDVADRVIVDFLNRTDLLTATGEELLLQAESAYKSGADFTPYLSQITFTPARIDQNVLSLFGEYVQYKGSSHPEVTTLSTTYDLTTGYPLSLSDVITTGTEHQLLQAVLGALETQRESLYEGYKSTVEELLPDKENWYLSDAGLVFCFSPYEIAPYSAGVVTATIPYKELPGILNDAYFPAEKDTLWGELNVLPFTQENMARFTQSAEVVCGNGSTQAIVYTDGMLENVRVEIVNEQNYQTVLAVHALTSGDAIIIHGEAGQEFTVQYSSGDGITSATLTFAQDAPPSLS